MAHASKPARRVFGVLGIVEIVLDTAWGLSLMTIALVVFFLVTFAVAAPIGWLVDRYIGVKQPDMNFTDGIYELLGVRVTPMFFVGMALTAVGIVGWVLVSTYRPAFRYYVARTLVPRLWKRPYLFLGSANPTLPLAAPLEPKFWGFLKHRLLGERSPTSVREFLVRLGLLPEFRVDPNGPAVPPELVLEFSRTDRQALFMLASMNIYAAAASLIMAARGLRLKYKRYQDSQVVAAIEYGLDGLAAIRRLASFPEFFEKIPEPVKNLAFFNLEWLEDWIVHKGKGVPPAYDPRYVRNSQSNRANIPLEVANASETTRSSSGSAPSD